METKIDKNKLLDMYYYMRLGRALETRLENLYRQGNIPGAIYLSRGQEACEVGGSTALEADDVMAPTHRDMIAMLPRGIKPKSIIAQHFGKETGPTRGRGEADYLGDMSKGVFTTVSMLPDFYPVAAGAALAFKYREEKRMALAYCGEGATSRGDFHEALNLASIHDLPVVFFVVNNKFAYSTRTENEMKVANVADRAPAYGIPGVIVDGNDVVEVYKAVKDAADRARNGGGPTLVEGKTMRLTGHSGHDPFDYVRPEEIEEWEHKDPIDKYEAYLKERGIIDDASIEKTGRDIEEMIEEGIRFAQESPEPDPGEVTKGVFH